jgi:beta-glucanase (GH16 family)
MANTLNFPANPANKPGYKLEFQDEFDGTTIDESKWFPYYLPHWSSRERSKPRYALTGEKLQLRIDEDQLPWTEEYDGKLRVSSLQTACFSGPVGSSRGQLIFKSGLVVREVQPTVKLYTPHYGYFETRFKAVPIPGYMCAFWMIGLGERPEESGEICIAEIFGQNISATESQINFGVHPFQDPAIKDEFYENKFPIDAANFHIYAAEWTPTHIDFFIDNVKVKTIYQSHTYPMQFMLNIYERPDLLTPESRKTPFPKVMEVDYVRAYQPLEGYKE